MLRNKTYYYTTSLILQCTTDILAVLYLSGVKARAAGDEVDDANDRGHRRGEVGVVHELIQHFPVSRQQTGDLARVDLEET